MTAFHFGNCTSKLNGMMSTLTASRMEKGTLQEDGTADLGYVAYQHRLLGMLSPAIAGHGVASHGSCEELFHTSKGTSEE